MTLSIILKNDQGEVVYDHDQALQVPDSTIYMEVISKAFFKANKSTNGTVGSFSHRDTVQIAERQTIKVTK